MIYKCLANQSSMQLCVTFKVNFSLLRCACLGEQRAVFTLTSMRALHYCVCECCGQWLRSGVSCSITLNTGRLGPQGNGTKPRQKFLKKIDQSCYVGSLSPLPMDKTQAQWMDLLSMLFPGFLPRYARSQEDQANMWLFQVRLEPKLKCLAHHLTQDNEKHTE